MLINLKKSQEELREQIGNIRTDIRKAEKNGVIICLDPTKEDIASAYKLYYYMMKKKYLPVEKTYALGNNETTKIIIAKYNNIVIGYIQFKLSSLIDRLGKAKICAFETIASDDSYKHLASMSLLYWEGILYMKSLGFEYLNFNGVTYEFPDKDLNSLAFFKKKRNGLEIQCISQKSVFEYIYRKYLRKYTFIKKISYLLVTTIFSRSYLPSHANFE